jgi:hypothetical protein
MNPSDPPSSPINDEKVLETSSATESSAKQYVVTAGNLFDGYEIHGPFQSAEEANDWADDELQGVDWVCGPLTPVVIR